MAQGKPYTKEFKENAVRLSMSPGKTVAEVARVLVLPRILCTSGDAASASPALRAAP